MQDGLDKTKDLKICRKCTCNCARSWIPVAAIDFFFQFAGGAAAAKRFSLWGLLPRLISAQDRQSACVTPDTDLDPRWVSVCARQAGRRREQPSGSRQLTDRLIAPLAPPPTEPRPRYVQY